MANRGEEACGGGKDFALPGPAYVDGDQVDGLGQVDVHGVGTFEHDDARVAAQPPGQCSVGGGDGVGKVSAPSGKFGLVVCGEDRSRRGVRYTAHTAGRDGGCGAGGPLQAACFDLAGTCIEQIEG